MTLTKTGFLQYNDCSKEHWVRINRPGEMPPSAPNAFVQMLMKQGYEVEALARSLIETWPDADQFAFQVDFLADGLEARADAIRSNEDGSIDLFEIKSSTSITRDLMKPFEEDYVDGRFGGSTSIKKVLPVLVPDLKYNASEVHDGTGALEAWKSLITTNDTDKKAEIRRQLLAYCELDTLAMVEIYKVLRSIAV